MPRRLRPLLLAVAAVLAGLAVALGGLAGDETRDPPGAPGTDAPGRVVAADPEGCSRTDRVVEIGLSGTRYPAVRAHWERAIAAGRPRVLTIHRADAARRRARLLRGVATAPGKDRDEYPPAMARRTVDADVALVASAQNRGAGAVQGAKLRRWCSGQRFRIVWY